MKERPERLDKVIAAQTSFSRRDVQRLITRGEVLLNGKPARSGSDKVFLQRDEVVVSGQTLVLRRFHYIMMNKPRGVISATSDAAQRTVLDLIPPELMRKGLFPAGRLDKDSTGFVLLTNDGALAHRILSPKAHVPKEYLVTLDKPIPRECVQAFAEGVTLADGTVCKPAVLTLLQDDCMARVELRQGIYHQIKRMFGVFDLGVQALHRHRIGSLSLDTTLAPGACRELLEDELAMLEAR